MHSLTRIVTVLLFALLLFIEGFVYPDFVHSISHFDFEYYQLALCGYYLTFFLPLSFLVVMFVRGD